MVRCDGRWCKRLGLICIGDEICSVGRRWVLSWAYLAASRGRLIITGCSKFKLACPCPCSYSCSCSCLCPHSWLRPHSCWLPASLSLSLNPPLSKCNPNGDLALCGEKNYDLKRPASVQIFVPVELAVCKGTVLRVWKRKRKYERGIGPSISQFDRFFCRWHKQKLGRPPSPAIKGELFPKSSSFYRPAFDISWPPISSYWT